MKAPGRFWVIMHPDSGGDVIARFDTEGETLIPDEIANYDDFVIQEVADRSALVDKTIDQSGLSEEEKDLLDNIYPVPPA